jgi:amino acid adenylation domain-containing protein
MNLEVSCIEAASRIIDQPDAVSLEGPNPGTILAGWNATHRPILQTTLPSLFEQQVERTPHSPALVFGQVALCYADVNKSANRLAHHLIERGIGPEDIIGVALDRSPEMIIAVLAILKAGAAFFPIDPNHPEDRLHWTVRDANPICIITNEKLALRLRSPFPLLSLNEAATRAALMSSPTSNPSDKDRHVPLTPLNAAYVIYTSGSTGLPKGVVISHAGIPSLVCSLIDHLAITPKFRLLQFVSSSFDVFLLDICLGLLAGGQLILAHAEDITPGTTLQSFASHTSFNHLNFPSAGLRMMAPADLPECASLFIGGEQSASKVVEEWSRGRRLINSYGLSEATVCSTVSDPLAGAIVPPIGGPIYNTQVYVLDSSLRPVAIGATGELYIAGAGLARGYLGRPDLTAERFVACPFGPPGTRMYRTGDLVRWRADGMLDFIGRDDCQVKINGFRIELGEIESVLTSHPAVLEAVVVMREDKTGVQRLCAYVMPADPAVQVSELRCFLKDKLPVFMLPKTFLLLDKFPLGPNGKLNRMALPVPSSTVQDRDAFNPGNENPTEQALASIWADLLGSHQVGPNDKFFDLGGNSLDVGRLISMVSHKFGVNLSFLDVFRNASLQELAKIIDEKSTTDGRVPAVVPLRHGNEEIPIYFICNGADQIKLAGLINTGQPVFAIEAPFLTDWCKAAENPESCDLPTMEQLVAPFLEVLHAHNGTTPCMLAGYSFSGVMAFEIARQLLKRGVKVADVIMVDSFRQHPNQLALQELKQGWGQFLRGETTGRTFRWMPQYAKNAVLVFWYLCVDRLRALIRSVQGKRHHFFILDERGDEVPAKLVLPIFINALRTSIPLRLDARGILFRASSHDRILDLVDKGVGWKNLFAQGVEIIFVPGDHLSMVRRQDTSDLSRELNRVLTEALNRPIASSAGRSRASNPVLDA